MPVRTRLTCIFFMLCLLAGAWAQTEGGGVFSVRLAAERDVAAARALVGSLRAQGYIPFMVQEGEESKVYVGRFATAEEAARMRAVMVTEGFTFATVEDVTASNEIGATAAAKAPKTKTVPNTILNDVDWQGLSAEQQEKVMEVLLSARAQRMRLQSVDEVLKMRRTVQQLNDKQLTILDRLEKEDAERDRVSEATRAILTKINRAQDSGDYDTALALVEDLRKIDPNSPLIDMKISAIDFYKKQQGAPSGGEQNLAAMAARARDLANSNDTQGAYDMWRLLLANNPSDPTLQAEARKESSRLGELLKQSAQDATAGSLQALQKQLETLRLYGGGGLAVLLILLIAQYLGSRKRYSALAQQIERGAGAPRLPSAAGALAGAGSAGFLDQKEDSRSDFLAPEPRGSSFSSRPGASEESDDIFGGSAFGDSSHSKDSSDSFFANEEDSEQEATPIFGDEAPAPQPDDADRDSDSFAFSFDDAVGASSGSSSKEPEAERSDETIAFSFGGATGGTEREASQEPSGFEDETLAFSFGDAMEESEPQQAASDEEDDAIAFSFGDATNDAEETSGAGAITAAEVEESQEQSAQDDIVFTFDDTVANAPDEADEASLSLDLEEPKAEHPGENSAYESIPLEEMQFDLDLDTQGDAEGFGVAANPLAEGGLDFDFSLAGDTNAQGDEPIHFDEAPQAPVAEEAEEAPQAPTGGILLGDVLLSLDYGSSDVGEMPEGWGGDEVDYASLTVVEDPDGTGEKCLQFQKTAGEGPTSYACRFHEISGRVNVEFDLRCDEKNKHLLGLYLEADSDFRRSVHTVVQCTDPSRPAHLRVFTRPTPYEMGAWSHVRFLIDLNEGMVDGYIDDELVAEGVRMGTKTAILNTLSIRDNSETTGTLLLKNFIIHQVAEEA